MGERPCTEVCRSACRVGSHGEQPQARQKHFLVPGARLVVGRSIDVDICIDENAASGHHAAFEARDTGVFLIDFLTRNGTYVNGSRVVESVQIESGDVVTIGDTQIIFVAL